MVLRTMDAGSARRLADQLRADARVQAFSIARVGD
jgi:hypothetical protein